MKKYAIIPINRKYNDDGTMSYRSVLISYKRKNKYGIYKRCKLIAKDPYFTDPLSAYKYRFTNKGFIQTYTAYFSIPVSEELNPYCKVNLLLDEAYEFVAKDNKKAIEFFLGGN